MVTGPNGNSIFLPAAGHRTDTEPPYLAGGLYWSSSLARYGDQFSAWALRFYESDAGKVERFPDKWSRDDGLSIRPVYGEIIPVESISLDKTELEIHIDEKAPLTATVLPVNATFKGVTWASSDVYVARVSSTGIVSGLDEGTAIISATTLDGELRATCMVTVKGSSSQILIPNAVDLGLPSGLKWASFNLGATKPEEPGDYYAWGEIEPYYSSLNPLMWKDGKETGYSWLSYKWCMGAYNQLTKYCYDSHTGYNGYTDERTILDLEDDAVRANLGGNWRMPTEAEWTELRENCTWTWTSQNRVNGYLVTASNGNSIFLPTTGNYHEGILKSASQIGYYWSTALYVNHTPVARDDDGVPYNNYSGSAWGVYFAANHVSWRQFERRDGFALRPVCK
jgi:hypothetical protein